jgi:hypothetical protein
MPSMLRKVSENSLVKDAVKAKTKPIKPLKTSNSLHFSVLFLYLFHVHPQLLLLPAPPPSSSSNLPFGRADLQRISNKAFGGGAAGAEIDSLSLGLSLSHF